MSSADLPPLRHENVSCIIAAAARYGVPTNILLAIAENEAGAPGLWVRKRNGTHDVGPMQFNTTYLSTLGKYGITPQAVAAPGCYAYERAAWRLRQHMRKDQGDMWTRAANYHSRTPIYNARYRLALIAKSARWAEWLERCAARACFETTRRPLRSARPADLRAQPQMTTTAPPRTYVPRMITVAPKA